MNGIRLIRLCLLLATIYHITEVQSQSLLSQAKDAIFQLKGNVAERKSHASTPTYRAKVPPNTVTKDRANGLLMHKVVFAIKKRNLDQIKTILLDVSDPNSINYGKHLTRQEVDALTSNPIAVKKVKSYLGSFHSKHAPKTSSIPASSPNNSSFLQIIDETPNGDYITVMAPVSVWEEVFSTTFYQHIINKNDHVFERTVVRAFQYWLPDELMGYVEGVFGVSNFPSIDLPTRKNEQKKKNNNIVKQNKPVKSRNVGDNSDASEVMTFDTNLESLSEPVASATAAPASSPSSEVEEEGGGDVKMDMRSLGGDDSPHDDNALPPVRSGGDDDNGRGGTDVPPSLDFKCPRGANGDPATCTDCPGVRCKISGGVTPYLINSYYGIDNNKGLASLSQAVYEAGNQSYSRQDRIYFNEEYGIPYKKLVDIGGHHEIGFCNPPSACEEGNLDVMIMASLSQETATLFWYSSEEDYSAFCITVAKMKTPPQVISISYGGSEENFSDLELHQFDAEAMILGVMGVTIIVAAGDDGITGGHAARKSSWYCAYVPSFPASSPWVTAVGATMGPESGKPEVVCQSDKGGQITSGGGFSEYYARPSWQENFVNGYFTHKTPYPGYNRGGRGYPDVTALGHNYYVYTGGKLGGGSGTSAAAPLVASMVSLVNAARVQAGLSTLGFINPALYNSYKTQSASDPIFLDITEGINNCAAGGHVCCAEGFPATAGWDPVSGLGSIHFQAFKKAFMSLGKNSGKPSSSTKSPTTSNYPTARPTPPSPLIPSGGWMYQLSYSDNTCTSRVTQVDAVPVGTCIPIISGHGSIDGWAKYSCSVTGAHADIFSDPTCSHKEVTSPVGLGCASSQTDDSTAMLGSQVFCTGTSCINDIIPWGEYYVSRYYASSSTCLGGYTEYKAMRLGECFSEMSPPILPIPPLLFSMLTG